MTPDKATALREAAEAVFSEICLIDACGQVCVDGDSIERGVRKALEPLLAERERLRGALEEARGFLSVIPMARDRERLRATIDQALEATDDQT